MTAKLILVGVLATALAGCIYYPRYDDYPRRRPAVRVESRPPATEPAGESTARNDDWSMNERGVKEAPVKETSPEVVERVYYVRDYAPARTTYIYDPWPTYYWGWGWHWHSHWHRRCHPSWGVGIHWHLR